MWQTCQKCQCSEYGLESPVAWQVLSSHSNDPGSFSYSNVMTTLWSKTVSPAGNLLCSDLRHRKLAFTEGSAPQPLEKSE